MDVSQSLASLTLEHAAGASVAWQVWFLVGGVVLTGLQTYGGWRHGPFHQCCRIAAVVAAYLVAFFGGKLAVPLLRPLLGYPDFALALLGGASLGILTYLTVSGLGAFLHKKMKERKPEPMRLGFAISGASLGFLTGIFAMWLLATAIRAAGTVAEAQMQIAAETDIASVRQPAAAAAAAVVGNLARMKRSIELGPAGALLGSVDPLPGAAYQLLGKLGMVLGNPRSVERFLTFPATTEIANHPQIVALRSDPQIAELAAQGNFLALLSNEKVVRAANDPELGALLRNFEIQKAMDYALDAPASAPTGDE